MGKLGKKGLITMFFTLNEGKKGEKPIITDLFTQPKGPSTHNFGFILFKGYLGQNKAYIDGTGVQAPSRKKKKASKELSLDEELNPELENLLFLAVDELTIDS